MLATICDNQTQSTSRFSYEMNWKNFAKVFFFFCDYDNW